MRRVLLPFLVLAAAGCGGRGARSFDDVAAWRARLLAGDAAALATLHEAGTEALPLLLALLADRDPNVVAAAAAAVERLGPAAEPAVDLLLDAVRRFPGEPRHLAPLRELRTLAVPHLVRALEGDDPALRAAAVEVVTTFGPVAAPAVPALVRMLERDVGEPRRKAAVALGGIGAAAREALPILERLAASTTGLEQTTFALSARHLREASAGAAR